MEFEKKVKLQTHNRFDPKAEITEVLAFVREQRVAGQLQIVLPGNGGVTSIVFEEKARLLDVEQPDEEESEKV